jgi:hypothetical protein
MKTSWNETRQIDAYLSGSMDTGNALLFEANMVLEPALQDKALWQIKAHTAIQHYGRAQLKKEIEAVHQKLFTAPEHVSFKQKIRRLFSNL